MDAIDSLPLSRRVEELRASSTLAVGAKAKELRSRGIDVLSFAAGEPDFGTPERVCAAAKAAIDEGLTTYAPVPGDAATRRVIATKLAEENRIQGVTPEHVVISHGGKQSLYLAFQSLLDRPAAGEAPAEVLLPTPAWVSYRPQAELAGGRVVELPTTPETGFKIAPEQLRAAITPRSRVLLLNSPSNPCGTTYSEAELRAIALVVAEAAATRAPNLVILTDEIYEKLTFGGVEHFSVGAAPEVAERTITVNGLSKAYAMTGWRVGYMAGAGEFGLRFAKASARLQSQLNTAIPTFILPAVRVALEECGDEVERMRQAFAARSKVMYEGLSAIEGVVCPEPTGAFYAFCDISAHFGKRSATGTEVTNAMSFAEALLDEHHMAVVPGEDFGGCGGSCIRLTYATGESGIRLGIERLGAFVAELT